MAASKAMTEMGLRVINSTQAEQDDILENSDDDILTQEALDYDRLHNRDEWPESPESESEDEWSQAVFYTGPNRSIERHPKSFEEALKWRDLSIKANTIRRVCHMYSRTDFTTLTNLFLVTTCFTLGRPIMPQHAVVHFLKTWANVNFEMRLPFQEKSRSGLSPSLSGEPPRDWVLFDRGVTGNVLSPARADIGGLKPSVSQAESKPEIASTGDNSISNNQHTNTSPKFSPVSSKAIGGGQFCQSFPPPFLCPVLERIIENYVLGAYSQERLMDIYMLIMRHPSVPRVRHIGRHLFDRVGQILTSYTSPSLMVEDLLSSLKVDRNLHLSFTFSTMQELLRPTDSEDSGSTSIETMRVVVDLIHSNVQYGYLSPEEALGFYKQRAGHNETPGIAVLEGLAVIFHIPTSCYHLPHPNLPNRTGNLEFREEAFKIPVYQPQKQERPLRGDTIFPGLPLSDSESGSLSPEDGVTEDFWGFLMPSKTARELTDKFNLGRMHDHIRSKTPLREARRKGKIMSRREILQMSDSASENMRLSREPLFALPDEDHKSFLKRNPPLKRLRNRRLEREGTPVPEFMPDPLVVSVHIESHVDTRAPTGFSSHPTTELSTSSLSPNTQSPQAKESFASLETNNTPEQSDSSIVPTIESSTTLLSPSAQSYETKEPPVSLESSPITENTVYSGHPTPESSTTSISPGAQSPQTKESSVSLEPISTTEPTGIDPVVSSDANKTREATEDTEKGPTDRERENLACLRPGEAFTSLYPPPLSIHYQYNNAGLRPAPANVMRFSYFQSPQASSPGANATLNKIFDIYRDDVENNPDMIGIEGAMKYLGDTGVQLDEVACFAIAELLQSPSMGEFTRSGFLAGWKSLNCETLQAQAAYAKTLRKRVINEPDYFRRVYRFTFPICRLAGQKILPLEIACEQWRLFFTSSNGGITWNTPSTPWLDWWIEYLNEVWKRPINKDLWEQTEVLVRKTKEDENFGWWSAEGAWPGAIDEFVGWVTNRRGGSNTAAEAMEVE